MHKVNTVGTNQGFKRGNLKYTEFIVICSHVFLYKTPRLESTLILKGGLVRAFSLAFMIVSITIMSFIVFSVYTGTGGILTPKKVFTVLSLLINLRLTSVHFVVQNALAMSEGHVAISRIQVNIATRRGPTTVRLYVIIFTLKGARMSYLL